MQTPTSYVQPFNLSRFFLAKCFVGIILLALAISLVFFEIGKRNLVQTSEHHAVLVSRNLQYQIYTHYFVPKNKSLSTFDWSDSDQIAEMDELSRQFLRHLDVVKINIFNADRQLVYSTTAELIGKYTKDNDKLIRALGGENVSSMELARESPDIEHDVHSMDLLETYIPFRDSQFENSAVGPIVGSFEIYQDITGLYAQIVGLRNIIFVAAFGLMGVFFVFLYIVIRRADQLQRSLEYKTRSYEQHLKEEVAARTAELTKKTTYLHAILDNVPSAFILLDRDFRIKTASAALGTLSEYTPEEAIGKPCRQVLCPRSFGPNCPSRLALETGKIVSVVKENRSSSGENRFLEHTSVPIRENGSITSVLEIVTDITERKRIEERAIRTETLSATGEMAAVIAHEVRNSLTSLKLILQFLSKSRKMEREDIESVKVALAAVLEMEDIVTQLLNFARPNPVKFVDTDVDRVVEESIALVRHQMDIRRVRLEEKRDKTLTPLPLDPEHLKAAFVNILLNAIDATGENGRIRITTEAAELEESISDYFDERRRTVNLERGRRVVKIIFEDSGCGIAKERCNHIFDPFFTTKINGTGLGLPTAKRVVNEHGGTIVVKSELGEGSRFEVLLPCGGQG